MVSDASKKKAAAKKAAATEKRGSKSASAVAQSKLKDVQNGANTDNLAEERAAARITDRTCTGVLASHPQSRDIHIEPLSVTFHGHERVTDSTLELNYGRRYGLLGLNGCGKSTLLTAIGLREVPIPKHMDIYHLTKEIDDVGQSHGGGGARASEWGAGPVCILCVFWGCIVLHLEHQRSLTVVELDKVKVHGP